MDSECQELPGIGREVDCRSAKTHCLALSKIILQQFFCKEVMQINEPPNADSGMGPRYRCETVLEVGDIVVEVSWRKRRVAYDAPQQGQGFNCLVARIAQMQKVAELRIVRLEFAYAQALIVI